MATIFENSVLILSILSDTEYATFKAFATS